MELAALLGVRPGVTAVIGGGGKTTLLRTLGGELAAVGARVLLCTTTKILPFPDLPCAVTAAELERLGRQHRLLCAGTPVPGTGKLTTPEVPIGELVRRFDYVLAEADGAAHRPLKAHAPHEPVIPPEANRVLCVVGASGFGRSIAQVAHRPERVRPSCGGVGDGAGHAPDRGSGAEGGGTGRSCFCQSGGVLRGHGGCQGAGGAAGEACSRRKFMERGVCSMLVVIRARETSPPGLPCGCGGRGCRW